MADIDIVDIIETVATSEEFLIIPNATTVRSINVVQTIGLSWAVEITGAGTRLYFPSDLAAPVSPPFDDHDIYWFDTTGALRRALSLSKTSSAFQTQSFTIRPGDNGGGWYLLRQYVSPPLASGLTISGIAKAQFRAKVVNEVETWANAGTAISINVYSGDGQTLRGNLYNSTDDSALNLDDLQNVAFIDGTLSSVVAQAGDRIVIEIGVSIGCNNSPPDCDADVATVEFGDDSSIDLPINDTEQNQYSPWIEFPQIFEFIEDLPPFNAIEIIKVTENRTVFINPVYPISIESEATLSFYASEMTIADLEVISLISLANLRFQAVELEIEEIVPFISSVKLNYASVSEFTIITAFQFVSEAVLRYPAPFGFDTREILTLETEALYRLVGASSISFAPPPFTFTSDALLQYLPSGGFDFVPPDQVWSSATIQLVGAGSFTPSIGYQFTGSGLLILSIYSGFTPSDVVLIESEAAVRLSTAAVFQSIIPSYQFVSEALLEIESVGQQLTPTAYQFASGGIIILSTYSGFTPITTALIESESLLRYNSAYAFPTAPEPISLVSEAQLKVSTLVGFAVAKDAFQFASGALVKYQAVLGLEKEEGYELVSEAICKYASAGVLRLGAESILQIESGALVKFSIVSGFVTVIADVYQFTSTATFIYQPLETLEAEITGYGITSQPVLYLYQPPGISVLDEGILSISSRAEIRFIVPPGLTFISEVEAQAIELSSQPSLIYGGLTETLLRLAAEIQAAVIQSGALVYLYSEDTIGTPSLAPYQFTGTGVLDLMGQGAVHFIDLTIESLESDPLLAYGNLAGVVETDVAETWVLTTQSWHPSVYSNWDFNSFVEIDGKFYGAKEDGIYLLEGETDAGREIRSGLRLFTNLGLPGLKRIRMVQAEKCGEQTTLRVKEPIDETFEDLELIRRCFRGTRMTMGREFIMDFQDFEELGHIKVVPLVMVRDGREG